MLLRYLNIQHCYNVNYVNVPLQERFDGRNILKNYDKMSQY